MTRTRSVIGTPLALLLAVTLLCASPAAAIAAQSANFMLEEAGAGNAAGTPSGSTNYQMQGDVTWRQEAPLHSNSFQITTAPPAPASSAAASSSSSVSQADTEHGGHRGEGTTTTNPPPTHPAASSAPRSSSARSSSHASSVAPVASSLPSSSSETVTTSSSSSEDLRGAAESSVSSVVSSASGASSSASSSSSVSDSQACGFMDSQTVICAEPFWHPINMTPVPEGDHVGAQSVEGARSVSIFILLVILAIIISTIVGFFSSRTADSTRLVRVLWYGTLVAIGALTIAFLLIQGAQAAVTSPQRHVYNGHLLNASGQPITTSHYIRFSEWYSRDMDATDVSAGVINTGAATYAGYQEVHVVTPDSQGYFSVELGSGASLPNLANMATSDLDNLFLQVEVKAAGSLDTAYELLDVDSANTAIDRSPILSVPFAQNADLLDQREIGTGSGAIPLLMSGGVLPVATVPGGTNSDTFVVDSNNTAASNVTLQFGGALAETLKYDIANDRFTFSADVRVEGDLVVTGLINGIDISSIASSDEGKLRVSSGAGLTINITGGAYRINGDVTDYTGASGVAVPANSTVQVFIGSGGLTVRTSGFPTDESFIRLAEVVTNGIAVTQIDDGRVILSDDREEPMEINLHAEFPNSSYQADAVDNVGQLSVSLDNITLRNFYLWNSTRTTLQDYDVVVRVSLPADFVRWGSTPVSVSYRTTSADNTNSKVDISVFDTNGTPVTLGGSATSLASTSWATATPSLDPSATWTAGSEFLLKFKLYSKDSYQAHLGSLKLKYVRLAPQ